MDNPGQMLCSGFVINPFKFDDNINYYPFIVGSDKGLASI